MKSEGETKPNGKMTRRKDKLKREGEHGQRQCGVGSCGVRQAE